MATAIYMRVSSDSQTTAAQEADLQRWASGQACDWYTETASGTKMSRKVWREVEAEIAASQITTLVVWRLDRLGRTASGLTALFDFLRERNCNLISLRDGLDLSTPAGRLMAGVLASVAQYETEVRKERQIAGIAAYKASGGEYKGWPKGKPRNLTPEKLRAIKALLAADLPIAQIARQVHCSRATISQLAQVCGKPTALAAP